MVVLAHNYFHLFRESKLLGLWNDNEQVCERLGDLTQIEFSFDKTPLTENLADVDLVGVVANRQRTAFFLSQLRQLRLFHVEVVHKLLKLGVGFLESNCKVVNQRLQILALSVLFVVPLKVLQILFVVAALLRDLVLVHHGFAGRAVVQADLLVLFAREVELSVELGRALVHLHESVQIASFEDRFVAFDVVQLRSIGTLEGPSLLDFVLDLLLALVSNLLVDLS